VLDGRLEAWLARRHEHRDDAQPQAQPADSPDRLGMDVSPWKTVSLSNWA
jgi:hypothetical protein